MIKERPASMLRVVLAFVGTAVVALLPVVVLALTNAQVRSTVADTVQRYGVVAVIVLAAAAGTAAAMWMISSAARRKPRAIHI